MSTHTSRVTASRVAVALALAALTAVAGLLTAGSSVSHADACTVGPVSVSTKKDTLLKSSMRLKVFATCEGVYDATARGYLYVGGHRTGRLPVLTLTNIGVNPMTTTITIPKKVLTATRAYAHRRQKHRVMLKFIVRSTNRTTEGAPYPGPYALHNQLRV